MAGPETFGNRKRLTAVETVWIGLVTNSLYGLSAMHCEH